MDAMDFVIQHLETAHPSNATPLANLLASDIAHVAAKAAALHARLDAFRIGP